MYKTLRNPLIWFTSLMICLSLFRVFQGDNLNHTIRSDGRGYYAYLPALLIYQDASFEKSSKVEQRYSGQANYELYLFKDDKGHPYNKYFPGLAVLQLPFFAVACAVSIIAGQPIDGYSDIFIFCFYLGSLFYATAGLFLFARCLKLLFPTDLKRIRWLIPLFYVATPLLFYTFFSPSYTHVYSFFLFGLFALHVLKLKSDMNILVILFTFATLGLIFLVRPTNLFIALIIPFLLGDRNSSVAFVKKLLVAKGKMIFIGVVGFISVISILFLTWKWQSGHWILWSYSGEGFNFLHPKIIETFFSFRIGLFVHTPLLLLSVVGVVLFFRINKFAALFWCIYFFINAWIIASWWCWDYESTFGHRPFTEHLFFLLIPVIFFYTRYKKITLTVVLFFAIIGGIRFWEMTSGFMPNQRFTAANYIPSLAFWNEKNSNRWIFTQSCQPYGIKVNEKIMLEAPQVKVVEKNDVFVYTVQTKLDKFTRDARLYYSVELEKKISEAPMDGVLLVIEAKNEDESKRFYNSVDLFNDRYEGEKDWSSKLIFEGIIHDHLKEYEYVTFYIWNQSGQQFWLRNVKISLTEYKGTKD